MEIKEAQKESSRMLEEINTKLKINHDPERMFLSLVEEIGELAREYQNSINNWREEFDKEKFSKELTDVLTHLLILAKDFDVDIEGNFDKKIKNWRERFELD
jgi:NTP pyrophosphatase (non-canonical NTP hydrolase)